MYERAGERKVRVTTPDGRSGLFTDAGRRLEGDLGQVDPNMCDWIGGRQLPGGRLVLLSTGVVGLVVLGWRRSGR